jgi:heme/copper-type cytochrome/quinol oxidase subunit 2
MTTLLPNNTPPPRGASNTSIEIIVLLLFLVIGIVIVLIYLFIKFVLERDRRASSPDSKQKKPLAESQQKSQNDSNKGILKRLMHSKYYSINY